MRDMLFTLPKSPAYFPKFSPLCSDYAQLCPISACFAWPSFEVNPPNHVDMSSIPFPESGGGLLRALAAADRNKSGGDRKRAGASTRPLLVST